MVSGIRRGNVSLRALASGHEEHGRDLHDLFISSAGGQRTRDGGSPLARTAFCASARNAALTGKRICPKVGLSARRSAFLQLVLAAN